MVLLFDLDGTILDTYDLIRANFITLFKRFLPSYKYTEDDLRSFFGPALVDTFRKIGCNEEETKMLFKEYRKISDMQQSQYLKLFPNTVETLEALKKKGYTLAIFSNKIKEAIVSGLIEKGLLDYFELIIGVDGVNVPKPNPEGILRVKEHFKDDCIYIGDAVGDMMTARNANVIGIGVTQSGTSKEVLESAGADYVIDKLSDIVELLEEINV